MGKNPGNGGGMGGSLRSSLSKFTGRVTVKAPETKEASAGGSLMSTPKPSPAAPAPQAAAPASQAASQPSVRPAAPTTSAPAAQQRVDPKPAPSPSPAAQAPMNTQGGNKLAQDVVIDGKLKFVDRLVFNGRLKGEITSEGALALQAQSLVEATITVKTVVIEGKVVGNVMATESARLLPSAVLIGNITTPSLTVDSGATFQGQATIGKPTLASK
ncbi:polymer-forming cytoskeletal protein [Roseibacillus persicicus]|nr:polymer-forming cytoskeletal protein [Roseibacillus persicicus]